MSVPHGTNLVDVAGLYPTNQTAEVAVTPKEAASYVNGDAKSRAWRTVVVGLGIDVATALVIVLLPAVSSIEWTETYWVTLGSLAGKSLVQAVVAYFFRLLVKPKVGVQI
jgi:hypothetical protein